MTSSNGNIFRVTGPLCGEFTGLRWIPRTKASDAELWCLLWSKPEQTTGQKHRDAGDLRRHRAYYDVIVRPEVSLIWINTPEFLLLLIVFKLHKYICETGYFLWLYNKTKCNKFEINNTTIYGLFLTEINHVKSISCICMKQLGAISYS